MATEQHTPVATDPILTPADIERFWSKVELIPFHECWEWTGAHGKSGHGKFCFKRNGARQAPTVSAQRIGWQIENGRPMRSDRQGCHTCDNPSCVRGDHIFEGTRVDNMQDAARKGRVGNDRRDYCWKGHPMAGDNLLIRSNGRRRCRTCQRLAGRRGDAKRPSGGARRRLALLAKRQS
jgi:hypothetical protein